MKEIKLLAVGNSFTEDALFYLHDICMAAGINCKVVNLYIGGCSLKRHWENIESMKADYRYEENGVSKERYVSANEVLQEEAWDFIITQQASHDSGCEETYFPYLAKLVDYFREVCPGAEVILQKTWAYEIDSTHDRFVRYHNDQQEMYQRLSSCYQMASEKLGLRLIPSADVIQLVRIKAPFRYELGEQSLYRDGFHMDMIYGRYLLGALFYAILFHGDIRENEFCPDGAKKENIEVIKESICEILNGKED